VLGLSVLWLASLSERRKSERESVRVRVSVWFSIECVLVCALERLLQGAEERFEGTSAASYERRMDGWRDGWAKS